MGSWVGHPALVSLRQAAVVLRAGESQISAVKERSYDNAHMISLWEMILCAGERFPGFKQRHRMVGLKPNSFLMNYGSGQGPLQ
jgi:hypothetical protein